MMNVSVLLAVLSCLVFGQAPKTRKVVIKKHTYLKQPPLEKFESQAPERATLLEKKRDALIKHLQAALKAVSDKDQVEDLKQRLANLYLEKAETKSDKNEERLEWIKKSANILSSLVENPERLFLFAKIKMELGKNDEAYQLYLKTLAQNTNAEVIAEAAFQAAEFEFENSDFSGAIAHYAKTLENPKTQRFLYALYKSGLAHYYAGNSNESVAFLRRVVSIKQGTQDPAYYSNLKREATSDLCLPLSDLKQYSEGMKFYGAQDVVTHRRGLECLVAQAERAGDHEAGIYLNGKLVSLSEKPEDKIQYFLNIVEIQRKRMELKGAIAALNEAVDGLKNVDETSPISQTCEALIRTFAEETHGYAQQTKNPDLYATAITLYQLYLNHFSQTAQALKTRFNLAEIEYAQGLYAAAAENYYAVFNHPSCKGPFQLEALSNAIIASSQQLKREKSEKTENQFLMIAQDLVKHYPQDPRVGEALFQMGQLRYFRHENEAAYEALVALIERFPSHADLPRAGHILLDISNQNEDYQRLMGDCDKLLSVATPQREPFVSEVSQVKRNAELKLIAAREKKNEFEEAAKAYARFYQHYLSQDPALSEKALFNAGVCYSKAGKPMEALSAGEEFIKRFPKSTLRSEVVLSLAKGHEASVNFGKAAYYFELFNEENPEHKDSGESLRLAGLYFWGGGFVERAEHTMLKFLRKYPESRALVERDLLEMYRRNGLSKKEREFLLRQKAVSKGRPIEYLEASVRLAELSGDWSEAKQLVDTKTGSFLTSEKGIHLIGRVLLKSLENNLTKLEAVKLQLPQQRLEKSVAAKLNMLEKAEVELTKLTQLGESFALPGLVQVSEAYEKFAREIAQAPVPTELKDEEVKVYQTELAEKVLNPLLEKAKSLTRVYVEKSKKVAVQVPKTPEFLKSGLIERSPASRVDEKSAWDHLNELRLKNPVEGIKEIQTFVQQNPDLVSFHNLLGLAYLDGGELVKAKTVWLSLLARGVSDPAIYNNLEVLEAIHGPQKTSN